jgi:hypothetical protein
MFSWLSSQGQLKFCSTTSLRCVSHGYGGQSDENTSDLIDEISEYLNFCVYDYIYTIRPLTVQAMKQPHHAYGGPFRH